MTKRAGKRKNRMGKGPLKPPPGPEGPIKRDPIKSITEDDGLSKSESLSLEMRALREGWLLEAKNASQVRQALLSKVAGIALKSDTDDQTVLAAFRALSQAEQRAQRLIQATLPRAGGDLPAQVTQAVTVSVEPAVERRRPFEVIQDLLADPSILAVVTGGDEEDRGNYLENLPEMPDNPRREQGLDS